MTKHPYPYQIIAYFTDLSLGHPIGPPWPPHITVKRRFALVGSTTEEDIARLSGESLAEVPGFTVRLGQVNKFDVDTEYVDVLNPQPFSQLQSVLTHALTGKITTRDPQWEGANAQFHLTTKFRGEDVVDPGRFVNKEFAVTALWLVCESDVVGQHAIARERFKLKEV